jgi:hypothetical protein
MVKIFRILEIFYSYRFIIISVLFLFLLLGI